MEGWTFETAKRIVVIDTNGRSIETIKENISDAVSAAGGPPENTTVVLTPALSGLFFQAMEVIPGDDDASDMFMSKVELQSSVVPAPQACLENCKWTGVDKHGGLPYGTSISRVEYTLDSRGRWPMAVGVPKGILALGRGGVCKCAGGKYWCKSEMSEIADFDLAQKSITSLTKDHFAGFDTQSCRSKISADTLTSVYGTECDILKLFMDEIADVQGQFTEDLR
jgi:hypothetical protein